MFYKFVVWLLISSKDPMKWSLSLKGFLGIIATVIMMVAGLSHINVGDLSPVIDAIIAVVQDGLALISALATVYGAIRKVVRTMNGEHAGLIATGLQ